MAPAMTPKTEKIAINQGAVPNQRSSVRPNHHPSAIATTNDSSPALSSYAVRTLFASDLLNSMITLSAEHAKHAENILALRVQRVLRLTSWLEIFTGWLQ